MQCVYTECGSAWVPVCEKKNRGAVMVEEVAGKEQDKGCGA
jgi:hypothetical protein